MAVFTESFTCLRQDLNQSHENRQRLIEDSCQRQLARRTSEQLSETGKARRAEFATMIRDLRAFVKSRPRKPAANRRPGRRFEGRGVTFAGERRRGSPKRWPLATVNPWSMDSRCRARIKEAMPAPPSPRDTPARRSRPKPATVSC